MFSGIVETTTRPVSFQPRQDVWELVVQRPNSYDDLRTGDSIAVNGVCLTVETYDASTIRFALGNETLKITGWAPNGLPELLNLERSLRLGDRIHGHLVQGHVDAMGEVIEVLDGPETRILKIEVPRSMLAFLWKKGSLAINGVSLTLNSVDVTADGEVIVSVCLVPETLSRTNLRSLRVQDAVTLEADYHARFLLHQADTSTMRKEWDSSL